jgi:hypothetical protein
MQRRRHCVTFLVLGDKLLKESGKSEVIRRVQYAHASPGIEDQQIVIAADNGLRTSCESEWTASNASHPNLLATPAKAGAYG